MGVVLYALLMDDLPFGGVAEELFKSIVHDSINQPVADFREALVHRMTEAKDLVLKMLTKDSKERITLEGVLTHPFITEDSE
jgi:serine/threonine protein kinase